MKTPRMRFTLGVAEQLLGVGSRGERLAWAGLLVLSIAAAAYAAMSARESSLEVQRLRAEVATFAVPAPAPRRPRQVAVPADALRQVDMVTARLNTPWSDVFDVLERRTPRTVALLAMEPDAALGSVALTAEALTLDELLAYAGNLGRDAAIVSVRMAQHELRSQDPGRPVRMTLAVMPAAMSR